MDRFLTLLGFLLVLSIPTIESRGSLEVVYEWNHLDYTWADVGIRQRYIENKRFIPENNAITGVKVYKGEVYVTVPRWLPGVPSTLNKVVKKRGRPLLQPFPSWGWQTLGRCEALQFTMSMEIDPIQGHMWIIDSGRRNTWKKDEEDNKCPPKLLIYDLESDILLHRHIFPPDVVSRTTNFINDIVVDFDRGYGYISDTGMGPDGNKGGVIVYSWNTDTSHRIYHPSMDPEDGNTEIVIEGKSYDNPVPVDGIALSPDGEYVFYAPLGGYKLYQLQTAAIRDGRKSSSLPVRDLGRKPSHTDGMMMGHDRLYFGSLSLNSVNIWEYKKDMISQGKSLGEVSMTSVHELVENSHALIWPDGFDLDEKGYLWISSNKLPLFYEYELNIGLKEIDSHFRISRIYVGDTSYKSKIPGWLGAAIFYGVLLTVASVLFFVYIGFNDQQEQIIKKKKR